MLHGNEHWNLKIPPTTSKQYCEDAESFTAQKQRKEGGECRATSCVLRGHVGAQGPLNPSGVCSNPMPDLGCTISHYLHEHVLTCTSAESKKKKKKEDYPTSISLQGHPGPQGPLDPSGVRSNPMPDLLGPGGMPLGLGMAHGGALAGMSPAMVARALDKPAPALPIDGEFCCSLCSCHSM